MSIRRVHRRCVPTRIRPRCMPLTASAALLLLVLSPLADAQSGPLLVSLGGPLLADSTLDIAVEGAPPPGPAGDPPAGLVAAVRMNGMIVKLPKLTWDPEDGVWRTTWHIPPGTTGQHVGVTAMTVDGTASNGFTIL